MHGMHISGRARQVLRAAKRSVDRWASAGVANRVDQAGRARFSDLERRGVVAMSRYSYGCPAVHLYRGDTGRVSIGSFVAIAEDVEIFVGGEHPVDWVSTYPLRERLAMPGALKDGLPRSKGDVHIGNDVWIGRGA